ncbi:MAG: hypothetical protein K2L10_07810 [Ruminococcus sp.]|nr:hypothetical protein [Ruminococcus sp.]
MKINRKNFISGIISITMVCSAITMFPSMADDNKFILGSVNGDNSVNAVDATEILEYYAGNSTGNPIEWSEEKIKSADVDGDGKILAVDATYVLMYYAYLSVGGTMDSISEYIEAIKIVEEVDWDRDHNDLSVAQIYDEETNQITLRWKQVEGVTGYIVKFYSYGSNSDTDMDEELILSENECSFVLSEDIKTTERRYNFTVRPYIDVKDIHKEATQWIDDYVNAVKIIVDSVELTPHDSYPLYNIKGDEPFYSTTYYVSDADRKILDEFAEEHFTPYMTNYDKLKCAWLWLNENVTYASGDLYYEIWGYSWVRACFVEKMGQCLQYNGALAELLAYMGYDVYMLEMWTDKENQSNQHFRAEVNIDGQAYSFEVGNQKLYPYWRWFFEPIDSSIAPSPEENPEENPEE